jgi:hypothetical protein
MIMPSYTTLPESMLSNNAILSKFASSSLAGLRGLGCDCSDTDDSGNCLDPECCPGDPGCDTTTLNCPGDPGCPTSTGSGTTLNYPPATGGSGTGWTSASCASSGGVLQSDGSCLITGGSINVGGSTTTTPTITSSTGLTPAQQNAIIQGSTQTAKIIAAGATGVTVLPNGAIVQNSALTSGLLNSSTLTSMLPILLIVGAIALLAGRH